MFAIKSTAYGDRYASVTRKLTAEKTVRCPICSESYVIHAKTPESAVFAYAALVQRFRQECPRHVEFISADEAA